MSWYGSSQVKYQIFQEQAYHFGTKKYGFKTLLDILNLLQVKK